MRVKRHSVEQPGTIRGAFAEHGVEHIDAASGEAEDGLIVPLALCALTLVVGADGACRKLAKAARNTINTSGTSNAGYIHKKSRNKGGNVRVWIVDAVARAKGPDRGGVAMPIPKAATLSATMRSDAHNQSRSVAFDGDSSVFGAACDSRSSVIMDVISSCSGPFTATYHTNDAAEVTPVNKQPSCDSCFALPGVQLPPVVDKAQPTGSRAGNRLGQTVRKGSRGQPCESQITIRRCAHYRLLQRDRPGDGCDVRIRRLPGRSVRQTGRIAGQPRRCDGTKY